MCIRDSYNATYGVSDGEYTITLNNSMLEAKAIDDGAGNVYMDVNTANRYYNSRIYWEEDENCVDVYKRQTKDHRCGADSANIFALIIKILQ